MDFCIFEQVSMDVILKLFYRMEISSIFSISQFAKELSLSLDFFHVVFKFYLTFE